jgi:hypothetical protein
MTMAKRATTATSRARKATSTGQAAPTLETTWPQVLAWRLRRQLLDPVDDVDALDVVRRLCGVQAQVPASAALAIGVRQADPVPDAVDGALAAGELVRTWAMRGTLHLLTPDEAGAYLSLIAAGRSWEKGSWVRTFGVAPDEMVRLTEAVGEVLDDRVLTREELVAELSERLGRPDLEAELRSGWGAVLKPVAWQGVLCHGPSSGNRVTFARPDRLLPGWGGVPEPEDAARAVVPAYLRTYGPATIERFDNWLTRGTSRKPMLRSWFAALGDDLVTVDVEGTSAHLLAEDVDDLAATSPSDAVHLLPAFDQYVLGPGTAATEILDADRRPTVSRAGGWIAPVVVHGGRVAGVWERDGTEIDVRPFDGAGAGGAAPPAGALDAAVERMRDVVAALHPD